MDAATWSKFATWWRRRTVVNAATLTMPQMMANDDLGSAAGWCGRRWLAHRRRYWARFTWCHPSGRRPVVLTVG